MVTFVDRRDLVAENTHPEEKTMREKFLKEECKR